MLKRRRGRGRGKGGLREIAEDTEDISLLRTALMFVEVICLPRQVTSESAIRDIAIQPTPSDEPADAACNS